MSTISQPVTGHLPGYEPSAACRTGDHAGPLATPPPTPRTTATVVVSEMIFCTTPARARTYQLDDGQLYTWDERLELLDELARLLSTEADTRSDARLAAYDLKPRDARPESEPSQA